MTDFTRAYTSEWKLYRVNPDTWADAGEVATLVSASVSHDSDGDYPEIDSGSLTVVAPGNAGWDTGYYRLAMRAIQGGVERVDVATLLCESSGGQLDYGADTMTVECRSVLHPAATTHVTPGEYAAAGQDGAEKAAELLRGCIQAPVQGEGSFSLADHYNFDIGQPVLEAVWMLLNAGGFCMWVTGHGEVRIAPLPTEPSLTLDRTAASVLGPTISHTLDTSEIPNRYTADEDGIRAIAQNNDAGSIVSHSSRGYWVDEYDSSPARLDGETLSEYAGRKLQELSTVQDKRTYTRHWHPDIHVFSVVRGSMAEEMLSGDMRVVSQSVECNAGIEVTETAAREVKLWL